MAEAPYALGREDFERMARAVRRAEGLPRRDAQQHRPARAECLS